MKQFVPMTDELLYQRETLPGPLVPYQCGVPCWHELRADAEARENSGVQSDAPGGSAPTARDDRRVGVVSA